MMISFIIPAYNEAKYIGKCLQSLLAQKTPSYEIIVVDNNSKDATAQIVQRDFPCVRIVHEFQQGITHARNKGAKEATGDILAFIDADTMLPDCWAQRMLSHFAKNPNLAGVSGPSRFYDFVQTYRFLEWINFHILFPFVGEFLLKKVLKRGALWNGTNIAVKKSLFEKVGGFSEDIVFYGEDADLARKMMRQGDIAFLGDLWVWTSARRLLKGHPLLECLKYVFQYSWFLITNTSRAKTYKEIR